jgi:hypothetical protein
MSNVTEAEIRELLDRQKCYDVLTRYCRALDRADVELMKTVYWEDAVDEHGVFEGNAHDFAEFIIREIRNWFEVATHYICNVHMEYYGDVMCTESYLISYCSVTGDPAKVQAVYGASYLAATGGPEAAHKQHAFLMGGRYVDRLEKRNGEWRIAHRRVVMDWNENWPSGAISAEGMFASLSCRGTRDRSDPVYQNRP